jgi:hypothetical protein
MKLTILSREDAQDSEFRLILETWHGGDHKLLSRFTAYSTNV